MFNLFKKAMTARANREFLKGIKYLQSGDYHNAIKCFTYSIQSGLKIPAYYLNRGNVYRQLGNYEKAIDDLEQAEKLADPSDTEILYEIYVSLGCTLNRMGKSTDAIPYFMHAIKIKPNDLMAYVNRGIAYQMEEDYQKAIDDFSKVIELNPAWHGAFLNRGNMYKMIGEYRSAISDYEKFVELAPSGYDVKHIELELQKLRSMV